MTRSEAEQLARKRGQTLDLGKPKPTPIPQAESELEARLDLMLRYCEIPAPEREHRFHPLRSWRFDRAWPALKLAIECEGLTHDGGRHQRVKGFDEDCRKYNAALLLGWKVFRVTKAMLMDGAALELVQALWPGCRR